jgi:hypothetical protein
MINLVGSGEPSRGAIGWRRAMNRLPLLPLALPFACLALLSLVAFLGVAAIAGAWASEVQMATRGME